MATRFVALIQRRFGRFGARCFVSSGEKRDIAKKNEEMPITTLEEHGLNGCKFSKMNYIHPEQAAKQVIVGDAVVITLDAGSGLCGITAHSIGSLTPELKDSCTVPKELAVTQIAFFRQRYSAELLLIGIPMPRWYWNTM